MPDNRHALPQRPGNHVIVMFGATGDLAKRKLLPGLFRLHAAGLLPREYRIMGSAPGLVRHDRRAVPRARQAGLCGVLHDQARRSVVAGL